MPTFSSIWGIGKRFVALTAVASTFGAGVLTAQASTPQFNNLLEDAPTLQVAKPGAAWSTSTSASAGEYVNLLLWDHNTVPGSTAENVTLKIALPSGFNTAHTSTGTVSASNATAVSGNATINVGTSAKLSYVSGSAVFYRNVNGNLTPVSFPAGVNPDAVVTTGINVGSQQGCWNYVQAVSIQVRVEGGTAAINTNKKVSNGTTGDFTNETTANPADEVQFRIFVQNTGTATGSNPRVTDVLDSRLSYVPGSSVQYAKDANNNDVMNPIPDSQMAINGQSLTWAFAPMQPVPQASFYIVFRARVAGTSAFQPGTTSNIPNTARVTFDGQEAVTNQTTIVVTRPVDSVVNFTLRKEVRNANDTQRWYDTQMANAAPGDTVVYRLIVTNTGNATANNVNLKDILPTGLTYVNGTARVYQPGDTIGTAVGNADVFGNGLNLGTIANGNTNAVTLIFNARVTDQCSGQQELRNVGQVFYNGAMKAEDDASIIFSCTRGLIVTKDVMDLATGQFKDVIGVVREGQTLTYRIYVQNNGNTTITNPRVKDVLPANVEYVANTLTIDGEFMASATQGYFFSNDGMILTNLTPGLGKIITFKAKVKDCPDTMVGDSLLVNTATTWADNVAAINDTATATLRVQAAQLPRL